ncbi:lipoprotein LpqH [Mycolicibacterium gilvum]|nr:lipoprotein LpqH [Mycolicibacterium gilvum]MCV7056723.1 lipoprotein LpqH [Mycolicibacterium gilvum]
MLTRHLMVAVAGSALVLGVAGCSTPEPALGGTTATVSIDGDDTGGEHVVRCHQAGWSWFIETPEEDSGFVAVVSTGETVTAESVNFRGFGGFTGSFWADNIGDAEVTTDGGSFTISGTADGAFDDRPSEAVSATFRIEADC